MRAIAALLALALLLSVAGPVALERAFAREPDGSAKALLLAQNSGEKRRKKKKKKPVSRLKLRHGVYSWTDEDGNVHSTDRLENVPAEFRGDIKEHKAKSPRRPRKRERTKMDKIFGPFGAVMRKIAESPLFRSAMILSVVAGIFFVWVAVRATVATGPHWGFGILIVNLLGVVYIFRKWKDCPVTMKLVAPVLWAVPFIAFYLYGQGG